MTNVTKNYTALRELMTGWFHQDFDLEGETIQDVIKSYSHSCSTEQISLLTKEALEFLSSGSGPLDIEFEKEFQPDIDPKSFSGSARKFLEEINAELTKAI